MAVSEAADFISVGLVPDCSIRSFNETSKFQRRSGDRINDCVGDRVSKECTVGLLLLLFLLLISPFVARIVSMRSWASRLRRWRRCVCWRLGFGGCCSGSVLLRKHLVVLVRRKIWFGNWSNGCWTSFRVRAQGSKTVGVGNQVHRYRCVFLSSRCFSTYKAAVASG